jgi:hypothetical protein
MKTYTVLSVGPGQDSNICFPNTSHIFTTMLTCFTIEGACFKKEVVKIASHVKVVTLHLTFMLSNLFFMTPSIATTFQYVNSLLFSFSFITSQSTDVRHITSLHQIA